MSSMKDKNINLIFCSYRLLTDPEEKKLEGISPVMGQYLGLHKAGDIKIGDPVYAVVK